MGALAKEKDLIVEYDDSERQAALEEAQLSVQSVDEQIKKAKADLAIHAEPGPGDAAQDAVRRAPRRVRSAEERRSSTPSTPRRTSCSSTRASAPCSSSKPISRSRQEQADSQLAVFGRAAQPQRSSMCSASCSASRRPRRLRPSPGWWPSGRTAPAISISASRCRTSGKAIRSSPACRWRTCWTFPRSRSGPRSANWTAPT